MGKIITTKIYVRITLLLGVAGMQAPLQALTTTIANMTEQEQEVIVYQDNCGAYAREAPKIKIKAGGYEGVPITCKTMGALQVNGKQYAPLKIDQNSFFLIEPIFNEKGEKIDIIVTVFGASDSQSWAANLGRAGRNLDKIKANREYNANLKSEQEKELKEIDSKDFMEGQCILTEKESWDLIKEDKLDELAQKKATCILKEDADKKQKKLKEQAIKEVDKKYQPQSLVLEKNNTPAKTITYKSPYETGSCYAQDDREKTDIYDLTTHPFNIEGCMIRDTNSIGEKSFRIKNKTPYTVYVRIEYEACRATGFVLSPGQAGRIFKAAGCVPYIVSGQLYKNGTTLTINALRSRQNANNHLTWVVNYDQKTDTASIEFKGKRMCLVYETASFQNPNPDCFKFAWPD